LSVSNSSIELNVLAQIEFVRDVIEIAKGFRLRGEMLRPVPFLEKFLREGKSIAVTLGIESCARVAIPVPGAADIAARLEDAHRESQLAKPVELVHTRHPGADDDGVVGGG